jgi:hypothetical protein
MFLGFLKRNFVNKKTTKEKSTKIEREKKMKEEILVSIKK